MSENISFEPYDVDSLPWADILRLARGVDMYGNPMTEGTLAVDDLTNKERPISIRNVHLRNAVYDFHVSGGCGVIVAEFLKTDKSAYDVAKTVCDQWLSHLDNPAYDQHWLTLTLAPMALRGNLFIVFNQLVYADGYVTDDYYRLILCFDQSATVPVVNGDMDYNKLWLQVESELQLQEEEMQEEVDAYEEMRRENAKNPYEVQIQEQILNTEYTYEVSEAVKDNPGMRIVKEDGDESED